MAYNKYDDNHPEVIKAKAEAEARLLEARSKLHPAAQVVYTLTEGFGQIVLIILLAIIFLAVCAPTALTRITGNG